MAEQNAINNTAGFKEAVCIDAGRVYDSCSEIHWSLLTKVLQGDGNGERGRGRVIGRRQAVIADGFDD